MFVHMPRQRRGGRSSAVSGVQAYCVCVCVCATEGTPGSRTITALAQRRVGQVRAQGSVTRPRRVGVCPYVCVCSRSSIISCPNSARPGSSRLLDQIVLETGSGCKQRTLMSSSGLWGSSVSGIPLNSPSATHNGRPPFKAITMFKH